MDYMQLLGVTKDQDVIQVYECIMIEGLTKDLNDETLEENQIIYLNVPLHDRINPISSTSLMCSSVASCSGGESANNWPRGGITPGTRLMVQKASEEARSGLSKILSKIPIICEYCL